MQKELENQFKELAKDPLATEDIDYIKKLFDGQYYNKKTKDRISVVGVYQNGSFVADVMDFDELVRYVWYHTKYSNPRKLFVEGNLLNYNLNEKEIKNLLVKKDLIRLEHGYVQFVYDPESKEMV